MKETEKTIWILNNYASHREQRHLELGRVFASHGYRVVIVTSALVHGASTYLYQEAYTLRQREENLYFVYLRPRPLYQNSGVKRVLNMFDFCWRTIRNHKRIAQEIGRPTYVIGSSVHPLVWESAYFIAKKYGAKFIAEFRDIWPLSLVHILGLSPRHPLVVFFDRIEKRAYQRADRIVATMPYADRHVCDELGFPREKFAWMPNGIRVDAVSFDRGIPSDLDAYLTSHWCCVYTGSFVDGENIELLLEAMKLLRDEDVYLALVGEGELQGKIEKFIKTNGLTHVAIFPKVNAEVVPSVLRKASCCVAAYADLPIARYGLSMIKLNDYLLSGTPVVFACSAPNVIQETSNSVVDSGDVVGFADAIRAYRGMNEDQKRKIGESGQELIKKKYDYAIIGENYLEMLEAL